MEIVRIVKVLDEEEAEIYLDTGDEMIFVGYADHDEGGSYAEYVLDKMAAKLAEFFEVPYETDWS